MAGFPTTLNPILQNGYEPVFVDIEIDTLNLNVDQLGDAAKSGAKAITFAHVLGNPPNMDRVMEIVKDYDLILLEDTCDALGSKYDGKLLGSFGNFASCSFYPAHHITMGRGWICCLLNKRGGSCCKVFTRVGTRLLLCWRKSILPQERNVWGKDFRLGLNRCQTQFLITNMFMKKLVTT